MYTFFFCILLICSTALSMSKKEVTSQVNRHRRTGSVDSPKAPRPIVLPAPPHEKDHKDTNICVTGNLPSLEALQGYYRMRLRQQSKKKNS